MRSWVEGADGSGFGAGHLPYGVFSRAGRSGAGRRVGCRIGDYVLDLAAALDDDVFAAPSLNPFLARGRAAWSRSRARLAELLTEPARREAVRPHLAPLDEVELHLPFDVADYVDFYCSLEHASNVGRVLRPDQEPLKPNWRHLPVGYHGRAGTVAVSGTPVTRPYGQCRRTGEPLPVFEPSQRLDIEAEVGYVVGAPTTMGEQVSTADFADHVFGVTLVNDWSARDIQAWEYVPLGPFLGKSFATSVAAWVTPLEALEAARVTGREQDPAPLPYLARTEPWGLDLTLGVELNGEEISRPPYSAMYWTPDQMLAHLTVNGASLRTGDLFASGTVSGNGRERRGSLLEITWNGEEPVKLGDGSTRGFLADGDAVTLTASAPGAEGGRITLGEVTGTVHPAV